LLTLSCFAALTAQAIDTSWQIDGTSNWFTPSNWSPGLPSPSFEYSYVDKGKAMITSPGATGRFVRIASDNFTTGTLEISGAGRANFTSLFIGGYAVAGGTGALNILSGGQLTTYGGSIGSSILAVGTVVVDGAGSRWDLTSTELNVGFEGSGTMTISNGAVVSVGGGTGTAILATARVSTGIINIGNGGAAGTLDVAKVQFGPPAFIESGWFGNGQLNFNHNESNYVFAPELGGYLKVQQVGTGTTVLNTDGGFVGQINSTNGKLVITANYTRVPTPIPPSTEPDPPPVIVPHEYINVNANGGIMELRDGGSIQGHIVTVGGAKGSTGTLNLTGAGTEIISELEYDNTSVAETPGAMGPLTGGFYIGTEGTGIVNISNGAKLSVNLIESEPNAGPSKTIAEGVGTVIIGYGMSDSSSLNATGILNIGDGAIINAAKIQGGPGSYLVNKTWNGNAQLNFVNSGNYVFDKEITGQIKVQQKGTGTTTLTKNSGFSGEINVDAGTLMVNSNITKVAPTSPRDPNDPSKELAGLTKYDVSLNVNVGQNGTLTGSGHIDADHMNVAGTLAPGNGLGLIHVGEDLTLTSTAKVVMELAGYVREALYDGINGEGILTLDGELVLTLTGGFSPKLGDTFTLFAGFDSVIGQFDKITLVGLEGLTGELNGSVLTITTAIPEPQTVVLVSVALGVLAIARLRRRSLAHSTTN
jgi:T5SS/PEP-CTERM-associated repeat protein/autotransporter-associated beta strand protein